MAHDLRELAWRARDLALRGNGRKVVLTRICDRADTNGEMFAGVTSLADDCGLSRRTVMNAETALLAGGFVEVVRPAVGRRPRTLRVVRARLLAASGDVASPQQLPEAGYGDTVSPQQKISTAPAACGDAASPEQPDASASGESLWCPEAPVVVTGGARCGDEIGVCGDHVLHESLNLESMNQEPTPLRGGMFVDAENKSEDGTAAKGTLEERLELAKAARDQALRERNDHRSNIRRLYVQALAAQQWPPREADDDTAIDRAIADCHDAKTEFFAKVQKTAGARARQAEDADGYHV